MVILYSHGGSHNHGCEALVRSTCSLIKGNLTLYSQHPEQDYKYRLNEICNIQDDTNIPLTRGTWSWFLASLQSKLFKRYDYEVVHRHNKFIKEIKEKDICISIGGDNYCYDGIENLAAINTSIRKHKAKTILWGCSVEPDTVKNKKVLNDLQAFDLITAREHITFDLLRENGCNVRFVPDTAFTLDMEITELPSGWKAGKMIGLNISPLVMRLSPNGIVKENYCRLIEHIIKDTDYNIALISHVVKIGDSDYDVQKEIFDKYQHTDRVILMNDYNCKQLKWFISNCCMFIGARTHASIAAYSTYVPTVVIGYSIKSIGIAKDLFGTDENYVIPVQKIVCEDELLKAFLWLDENKNRIKKHLQEVLPGYVQTCKDEIEKIKLMGELGFEEK